MVARPIFFSFPGNLLSTPILETSEQCEVNNAGWLVVFADELVARDSHPPYLLVSARKKRESNSFQFH